MPKPHQNLLVKGILCSLAGAVLVLAQYVPKSHALQNIMFWASLIGWFVLMMGVTLVVRYAKAMKALNQPAPATKSLGIVGQAPTQTPTDHSPP